MIKESLRAILALVIVITIVCGLSYCLENRKSSVMSHVEMGD